MAGRPSLSAMWSPRGIRAEHAVAPAVQVVSASGLCDGRHDAAPNPSSASPLVLGGAPGDDPHRRGGRQRDSKKAIVVGAVEVRGHGSGRIRLAVVEDVSVGSLVPFVEASVEPGSEVLTDGWQGYAPLRKTYDHRPTTQGDPKNAAKLFPRVDRAFSNLKTWLKGTHHGVSSKHSPHYVNEFVFRFNRRRRPMAALQSLLGLTAQHTPRTYKMLYGAE